jgi:hypothetical protein
LFCRDFETQVADGRLLAGHNDTYHGNQPLAYGADPAENVVFIGCHDNETIFDQVGVKILFGGARGKWVDGVGGKGKLERVGAATVCTAAA